MARVQSLGQELPQATGQELPQATAPVKEENKRPELGSLVRWGTGRLLGPLSGSGGGLLSRPEAVGAVGTDSGQVAHCRAYPEGLGTCTRVTGHTSTFTQLPAGAKASRGLNMLFDSS